jgi:carbamoyltransferase
MKNNERVRIVGLYSWHDGGYCVFENGRIVEHVEIERYNRQKASHGNSFEYIQEKYLKKNNLKISDIDHWVSVSPDTNLEAAGNLKFSVYDKLPKEKISFYSHHLCHASHGFYSSEFDNALILTVDSAGLDDTGLGYSITGYLAEENRIERILSCREEMFSLGNVWTKLTRFVFKLSAGYPRGCQAGSVMAMAAMGNHEKYYSDIMKIVEEDYQKIRFAPPGMVRGKHVDPKDEVFHPYLNKLRSIAEDEKEKFNIAASLQKVTEELLFSFISQIVVTASQKGFKTKNLCLVGGVNLNSVATGKIANNLSAWGLENVFVPPVPYDGGLNIGACQYHYHSVLGHARNNEFVSPYLGEKYTVADVEKAIQNNNKKINVERKTSLKRCAKILNDGKIVSIFNERSESGRRALGNRSIIANPRLKNMKELINKKVKHRQWYRPFAPSILEGHGSEWFENYFPSPYMGFVFNIKKEKLGLAPAIEHFDGTARIQSVNKKQNKKYYNLIHEFYNISGIPLVLNTSFNDREPIVENPEHAINCFLNTDIDFLYFPEYEILISRK